MNSNRFSKSVSVFHTIVLPETGEIAGYAAIIEHYTLAVPLPGKIALISQRHRQYTTEECLVLTPRHRPEDNLFGHLTFAMKYEGLNLGVLKSLFQVIDASEIIEMIKQEPTGQYSRRIWFLYEWLLNVQLEIPDAGSGNYIELLDESLQYGTSPVISRRHRIRNNLPGTRLFCPLISRTEKLEKFIGLHLSDAIKKEIRKMHPDIIARAAAFLLLKDSKASYAIEGERPLQNRMQRWGRAIGQAGHNPISKDELLRLQTLVIDSTRFTKMGWRNQGGFIGEHDREYGTPIPDHISAKYEDISSLMDGMIDTCNKLEQDEKFDAVLAAAIVAFGFVFIHPFVDGNGRIHRYLIHHVLVKKGFTPKGLVFPVSSVILEHIDKYREVLEDYSQPLLDLIEWKPTPDNNIDVLNDTIDLYRYFDITKQAEFLYECVQETIEKTVPEEVEYLIRYDQMKDYLDNKFEMPDKTVALLIRFLKQGDGKLSSRALTKEFNDLTENEITDIEEKYRGIFN